MTEDPMTFARCAIIQVSCIATSLRTRRQQGSCILFGNELFQLSKNIGMTGLGQEDGFRLRILNILRDIEVICNLPRPVPDNEYPLLKKVTRSNVNGRSYEHARRRIGRGLKRATKSSALIQVTYDIHEFNRDCKALKRDQSHGVTALRRTIPPGVSRYANELASQTIRKQMHCTCQSDEMGESTHREHLMCLLLKSPATLATDDGLVHFDMLFSSMPLSNESQLSRWQDVELLVPNSSRGDKHASIVPAGPLAPVEEGRFCDWITAAANRRLCLSIQDGELEHSFENLKRRIDHVPAIPLASILSESRLTARMKLILAYIIAYSVWQYYDSEWMNIMWTSDVVRFMRRSDPSKRKIHIFTTEPYVSVHLNQEGPFCDDEIDIAGMVHKHPKIIGLGVMLVEIAMGVPFCDNDKQSLSLAAKVNSELLTALEYTSDMSRWEDFEYPDYMSAVRHCLEPDQFDPYIEGSSASEQKQRLQRRRNVLYEKVLLPLESLLRGTKWMDDFAGVAPLDILSSNTRCTKSMREAKEWLSRLDSFHEELDQVAPAGGLDIPRRPVRIAILDTGLDEKSHMFSIRPYTERLKGWRDWVDGSAQPQDCHGHGTHLVSLVMRCAPEADIYVARIARDQDQLGESSTHVAEAILWASRDCEADIISMSFGSLNEKPCVDHVIKQVVMERENRILFFAAASNHGANDREMYPARYDSVISIRATNSKGGFEDFNPPKCDYDGFVFGTLGVDVPSLWPGSGDNNVKHQSGTSIATAIAAGIAGCLLEIASSQTPDKPFHDIKDIARELRGMRELFLALSSETLQAGYRYLKVWDLMGKSEDDRWAMLGSALSKAGSDRQKASVI
ncbi:subtilisin-like protein [Aspergillus steynii IBT 23096]|uniref:Subtilisin-like protein n=1 Tax=Aspergillus steynii IBT 23096 TaxID=1392250 RepID=A0A2I2GRD6_9EURO|nr:subtilisin-like protein [Aspergillus steynii IBT 23096]PLB55445.1 subtilisin-like protein [Aspergillus steynii IBT 23096]